ncbi:uncharacterized protein LOC126895461 [Daktulosphaira vitifoliae]|uniref:uncharacterized protein LOC126895461 n=1 Tax=Daktulosphaira vitifoliae TaxID=58002 RepID=UPI0021A9BAB9|nr:uncharacterized protein LOC126895461 [Daktulosphaira vitifoliae]
MSFYKNESYDDLQLCTVFTENETKSINGINMVNYEASTSRNVYGTLNERNNVNYNASTLKNDNDYLSITKSSPPLISGLNKLHIHMKTLNSNASDLQLEEIMHQVNNVKESERNNILFSNTQDSDDEFCKLKLKSENINRIHIFTDCAKTSTANKIESIFSGNICIYRIENNNSFSILEFIQKNSTDLINVWKNAIISHKAIKTSLDLVTVYKKININKDDVEIPTITQNLSIPLKRFYV